MHCARAMYSVCFVCLPSRDFQLFSVRYELHFNRPMLLTKVHNPLHHKVTRIRKANGRSQATSKRSNAVSGIWEPWAKKYFSHDVTVYKTALATPPPPPLPAKTNLQRRAQTFSFHNEVLRIMKTSVQVAITHLHYGPGKPALWPSLARRPKSFLRS
jgi:hypothetical protein